MNISEFMDKLKKEYPKDKVLKAINHNPHLWERIDDYNKCFLADNLYVQYEMIYGRSANKAEFDLGIEALIEDGFLHPNPKKSINEEITFNYLCYN